MTPESQSPPRVSWLGRNFGWGGTRGEWVRLSGILLALAGGWALAHFARNWSIGSTILAFSLYGMVLAVAGRDALRDLFGPVFFYDLVRVGRHGSTFGLRLVYVISISLLLCLLYFEWLYSNSRRQVVDWIQLHLLLAALTAIPGFFLARELAANKHRGWARIVGLFTFIAAGAFVLTALHDVFDPELKQEFRSRYNRGYSYDDPRSGNTGTIAAGRLSRFAQQFFEIYVVIQMCVVVLLTPVYVAGTIAVEKERKTLEFLFATDLRNREIVFGKMAARVLSLVMYALAGLPLLAFLQLFGGIDPEQLLASAVATVVLAIGLASLSISVSVVTRRARDAIMLSYVLTALYAATVFLPLITMIPTGAGWWNTPVRFAGYSLSVFDIMATLADGNPIWALFKVANATRPGFGITGGLGPVLRDFVLFWTVASLILLAVSIARLRSVALAQAYGPVQKRSLFIHPLARRNDRRRERRGDRTNRPTVGTNPVTWKEVFVDSTFRTGCLGKIVSGVILAAIVTAFGMVTYFEFFDYSNTWRMGQTTSYQWRRYQKEINMVVRVITGILGFVMFLSAAMRGASAISGEKDKDTWLSLISTPLSVEEILMGKFWGCFFSLRRAFFVLLLVWCYGLCIGAVSPIMLPVILFLTAVYVAAFSWIGIFFSIICRNTLRASIFAFFGALFAAGGFWIVIALACILPLELTRAGYQTVEQLNSFFAGWTPPLVYGVMPLRDLEPRELGPFDDSRYSAGLLGPIVGTVVWVIITLMMKAACENRLRHQTNRDPKAPPPTPRRRTRDED